MKGDRMSLIIQCKELFHNVYVYQIITLHTLNILQFCQLYLSKAEGEIKGGSPVTSYTMEEPGRH